MSGFKRFHFFWVCILWPWVFAFIVGFVISRRKIRFLNFAAPTLALLFLLAVIGNSNVFNHSAYYRGTKETRVQLLNCLSRGVAQGVPFQCPDMHPRVNMLNVYYRNLALGASYTSLVVKPSTPLGVNVPPPLYRLTVRPDKIVYKNSMPSFIEQELSLKNSNDPQVELDLADAGGLKNCSVLEINGSYSIAEVNFVQLFYLPSGSLLFSPKNSKGYQIAPGEGELLLQVYNEGGFEPIISFDPVENAAPVVIKQLEVRCVVGALGPIKL